MRSMEYGLRAAVIAAVVAVLVGTGGCQPDCQNSVQSNGPGSNVNRDCDK